MNPLVDFWRSRPPRERTILAAGATVVAAMLFIALAWLPLERARTRLEREVPELRAGIAARSGRLCEGCLARNHERQACQRRKPIRDALHNELLECPTARSAARDDPQTDGLGHVRRRRLREPRNAR